MDEVRGDEPQDAAGKLKAAPSTALPSIALGGASHRRLRAAIRGLVWASANAGYGWHDRASRTLLEIHDELTGRSLSREESLADLGSARRTWAQVCDALEWATSSRRLRIERAPEIHASFEPDDAPDTARDLEESPPSLAPPSGKVASWIGVAVQDGAGAPLANVRCRITAPGRPPLDAATDVKGRVVLRGIEIGPCLIEFPEVDCRYVAAGPG